MHSAAQHGQAAPLGKACRGAASHLPPLSEPGRNIILGSVCCLMRYDFCTGLRFEMNKPHHLSGPAGPPGHDRLQGAMGQ